jgi:hypothetical protein
MSTVTRTEGNRDDAGSSSGDEHWYLLLAFSHEEDTSARLTELDRWLSRRGQRRLRRVDFGVDVPAGEAAGALLFGGAIRSLELANGQLRRRSVYSFDRLRAILRRCSG